MAPLGFKKPVKKDVEVENKMRLAAIGMYGLLMFVAFSFFLLHLFRFFLSCLLFSLMWGLV